MEKEKKRIEGKDWEVRAIETVKTGLEELV